MEEYLRTDPKNAGQNQVHCDVNSCRCVFPPLGFLPFGAKDSDAGLPAGAFGPAL